MKNALHVNMDICSTYYDASEAKMTFKVDRAAVRSFWWDLITVSYMRLLGMKLEKIYNADIYQTPRGGPSHLKVQYITT